MSKRSRRQARAAETGPRPTPTERGASAAADPAATSRSASSRRSSSASGTARAGRRERARGGYARRSFLERNRTTIFGLAVSSAFVLVVGWVFVSAAQPAYACGELLTPAPAASPAPDGSPARLGQVVPDLGQNHVSTGAKVTYSYCPPASGPHYFASGVGPIAQRFYEPGSGTVPQGWVHNLEHGEMVILYACPDGQCPPAAELDALRRFQSQIPPSPVCGVANNLLTTRFDDMSTRYAAIVWDKVLLLDTLDTDALLRFYLEESDRAAPEPKCQRPPPTPAPTAAPSPTAAPTTSPAVSPSPS